jgi:hypothetical protein
MPLLEACAPTAGVVAGGDPNDGDGDDSSSSHSQPLRGAGARGMGHLTHHS